MPQRAFGGFDGSGCAFGGLIGDRAGGLDRTPGIAADLIRHSVRGGCGGLSAFCRQLGRGVCLVQSVLHAGDGLQQDRDAQLLCAEFDIKGLDDFALDLQDHGRVAIHQILVILVNGKGAAQPQVQAGRLELETQFERQGLVVVDHELHTRQQINGRERHRQRQLGHLQMAGERLLRQGYPAGHLQALPEEVDIQAALDVKFRPGFRDLQVVLDPQHRRAERQAVASPSVQLEAARYRHLQGDHIADGHLGIELIHSEHAPHDVVRAELHPCAHGNAPPHGHRPCAEGRAGRVAILPGIAGLHGAGRKRRRLVGAAADRREQEVCELDMLQHFLNDREERADWRRQKRQILRIRMR